MAAGEAACLALPQCVVGVAGQTAAAVTVDGAGSFGADSYQDSHSLFVDGPASASSPVAADEQRHRSLGGKQRMQSRSGQPKLVDCERGRMGIAHRAHIRRLLGSQVRQRFAVAAGRG